MKIMMLVLVLASTAFGYVRSGSSHRSDAEMFDLYLLGGGINTSVSIEWYGDGYQYIAWFDGDYYNLDNDADEVIAVALAAGFASAATDWSSVGAIAVYEDYVVGMFTADCREFVRICSGSYSDEYIGSFYLNNSYRFDRVAMGYPAP